VAIVRESLAATGKPAAATSGAGSTNGVEPDGDLACGTP